MNDYKSWLASKTVWGVIISLTAVLLGRWGFGITDEEQRALVELVCQVITVGSGLYTVYGRIKATKKIG